MLEAGNPASQGQIVIVDAASRDSIEGVKRCSYDGRDLPVGEAELQNTRRSPLVTLRAVMSRTTCSRRFRRRRHPSARRLRGRIVERAGRLDVRLPPGRWRLPILEAPAQRDDPAVLVIGQGSAHIAGRSLARALPNAIGR